MQMPRRNQPYTLPCRNQHLLACGTHRMLHPLLGSYLFFRCWMLPRHLSRPFTMMARRVQSASHSSMLGRQDRLELGG